MTGCLVHAMSNLYPTQLPTSLNLNLKCTVWPVVYILHFQAASSGKIQQQLDLHITQMASVTETQHSSTTLNGFSEVVATPFAADNILVDFAGRDVIVSLQGHVKESFVVAEVEIHLSTIVQHKHLPYTRT